MRNDVEKYNKTREKIDMSNIKKLRKEMNYNQTKLQHIVGVSESSIQAYEQNVKIPSLVNAYNLADALNCSIDFIVGRNNELENYYKLSKDNKNKVVAYINGLYEENN